VLLIGVDLSAGAAAKKEVYYFHNTRRCPTCNAIEKETKAFLSKNFAKEMESGELVLKCLNAEDQQNKAIVKKLGVSGSSLIVINNGKTTDLTSEAFMYALKQPEKLKVAIKEALSD
jgi:hypothetical protein